MKPISVPFRVEKNDSEINLIGYGVDQRTEFFKTVASWCKNGKIYQMTIKEVTASEVQRNYLFLCLSLAAEHIGYTSDALRALIENIAFECALDVDNDFISAEDWIIDIIDIETSEVKGQTLRHMSDWDVSMMRDFIDLFQGYFMRKFPEFKFPNPKDYMLPKVGRKNEVPFPNVKTTLKF